MTSTISELSGSLISLSYGYLREGVPFTELVDRAARPILELVLSLHMPVWLDDGSLPHAVTAAVVLFEGRATSRSWPVDIALFGGALAKVRELCDSQLAASGSVDRPALVRRACSFLRYAPSWDERERRDIADDIVRLVTACAVAFEGERS